jgi:hypothetical protein
MWLVGGLLQTRNLKSKRPSKLKGKKGEKKQDHAKFKSTNIDPCFVERGSDTEIKE